MRNGHSISGSPACGQSRSNISTFHRVARVTDASQDTHKTDSLPMIVAFKSPQEDRNKKIRDPQHPQCPTETGCTYRLPMSQNDSTYNLPLFVPYEARVEGPGGRSGFACESRTPSGRSECSVPPRDAARVSNRQLNSTNTEAESPMNQFTLLESYITTLHR